MTDASRLVSVSEIYNPNTYKYDYLIELKYEDTPDVLMYAITVGHDELQYIHNLNYMLHDSEYGSLLFANHIWTEVCGGMYAVYKDLGEVKLCMNYTLFIDSQILSIIYRKLKEMVS